MAKRKQKRTHLATTDSITLGQAPGAPAPVSRADGWVNFLTGMGVAGKDKTVSTRYMGCKVLSFQELRDLYRGDGFARRVVELPVKEMMRRGFELNGDEDRKVQGIFEKRGIHKKVAEMLRWHFLFGGSLGVMGIADGLGLDQPVNEKGIERLDFLHVFDRHRVTCTTADLYNDENNPKYGQPQFYNVSPKSGKPFRVHESRVLRMDGQPIDELSRSENQGWGDSVIQSCFEHIRAMGAVAKSVEVIVEDFVTAVFGMKDLADNLAIEGGEDRVRSRLNFLDLSRHVLRTFMIDAENENFSKQASTVTGLPDVMDRYAQRLAGSRGIPITLLMGQSPAGMDATGESDLTNWYDSIRQEQQDVLQPIYERLCYIAFLSKECGGKEPEDWKIEWLPLWEPSEKERAEIRKIEAEEVDILVAAGVLDPDELREDPRYKARFNLKGPLDRPPPADPFGLPPAGDPDGEGEEPGAKPPAGKPPKTGKKPPQAPPKGEGEEK
jgi:hypothetical protein